MNEITKATKMAEQENCKENANSFPQEMNFESAFSHLDKQTEILDRTADQLDRMRIRDEILLSLTQIQNALDQQCCFELGEQDKGDVLNATYLEMLFNLVDSSDSLVSYGSCQLIKKFAKQPTCQVVIMSVLVDQWSLMLSHRCTSVLGILHRVEILRDLFSKKFENEFSTLPRFQDTKNVIGALLINDWEKFLGFVLDSKSRICESYLQHNVIFSTCCLWVRLIKQEVKKYFLEGPLMMHEKILHLSELLLERLNTGSLSLLCVRKCLDVFLECLPYSVYLSPLKIIPQLYSELASKYLQAFLKNENRGFDCDDVNCEGLDQNVLQFRDWFKRSVIRISTSQGFGGYIKEYDGLSEGHSEADGQGLSSDRDFVEVDQTVLRKFALLLLKSSAVYSHGLSHKDDPCGAQYVSMVLISLRTLVSSLLAVKSAVWVMELFQEQDDSLLESLLCLLDIYVYLGERFSVQQNEYEPCQLFLQFLERCCWDHSLLLDLLMSPETCFLLYITHLLKLLLRNWDQWVFICQSYGKENITSSESNGFNENPSWNCLTGDMRFVEELWNSADEKGEFGQGCFDSFQGNFNSRHLELEENCLSSSESVDPRFISSLKQLQENYATPLLESDENCGVTLTALSEMFKSRLKELWQGFDNHPLVEPLCGFADNVSVLGQSRNFVSKEKSQEASLAWEFPVSNQLEMAEDCKILVIGRKSNTGCFVMTPNSVSESSKDNALKASCRKLIDYSDSDSDTDSDSDSSDMAVDDQYNDDVTDSVIGINNQFSREKNCYNKIFPVCTKGACHTNESDDGDFEHKMEDILTGYQSPLSTSCVESRSTDVSSKCSTRTVQEHSLSTDSGRLTERGDAEKFQGSGLPSSKRTTSLKDDDSVTDCCNVLDKAMTTVIQLRLSLSRLVEKNIFPYSVDPLIKLLQLCEEKYEEE